MTWRLRRAGAHDADRLSLVADAAFLDTYATSLDGTDLVAHCLKHNRPETFAAWASDPASVVTLAETEPHHAPIGYTVLTACDFPIPPLPGDIELRRIYTLRQVYGSGTGQALLDRALTDARALGARRLLLGVWAENHRARAFYGRQGFMVMGARQFVVGTEVHDDPIYALTI